MDINYMIAEAFYILIEIVSLVLLIAFINIFYKLFKKITTNRIVAKFLAFICGDFIRKFITSLLSTVVGCFFYETPFYFSLGLYVIPFYSEVINTIHIADNIRSMASLFTTAIEWLKYYGFNSYSIYDFEMVSLTFLGILSDLLYFVIFIIFMVKKDKPEPVRETPVVEETVNQETNKQTKQTTSNFSNAKAMKIADEIVKYKSLLDSGVLTEEEFTAKKKQLLQ